MADARARRRTLARRCMTFIAEHTQPCLSVGELSAVTPETLSMVLESDALRADELSLYRAVVAWGRAFSAQRPGAALLDVVAGPLRHIRLPLLSTARLMKVVRPDRLVAVERLVEALAHHADPTTVDASHPHFRPRAGAGDAEPAVAWAEAKAEEAWKTCRADWQARSCGPPRAWLEA